MILFITTKDSKNQLRSFSCWLTKLEIAFDVLSLISAGEQLVNVELIDNNKRIQLPAHVFKGAPFSTSILQLEQEWQLILSEPVN
ncbi:hypothetical protein [Spirosoma radiotolerans]|uniref:Uncharacterized protein n=1 Tax=Spirosoma radiotolerans TaxID=1379870 RepID=A0A0E3V7G4_9BACT|nr:hypothetical protein [Spirosoma radiotolerans]AKD55411.1 hypothetical protein SD10_11355 [Spirosoma radiotolerans]